MKQLFESAPSQQSSDPAKESESSAAYLARSGRPRWVLLRQIFEEWYSHYPIKQRADMWSRFHSDNNRQHYGAFFELYCHELLRKHGYKVEVHPEGDPTTTTVPDFLVTHEEYGDFYLEATTAIGDVGAYQREQRLSQLIDSINMLPLPGYCLSMSVHEWGTLSPSTKKVKAFLKACYLELIANPALKSLRSDYVYAYDQWNIRFGFIPVSKPLSRTIGLQTSSVLYDDIEVPLKRALQAKSSSKYGNLTLPYVVAVNSIDSYATTHSEIQRALIGEAVSVTGSGEWGRSGDWRRIGQSALLFVEQLLPWTIFTSKPEIWVHPAAAVPLKTDALRLPRHELAPNDFLAWQKVAGVAAHEVLNIPAIAPGEN